MDDRPEPRRDPSAEPGVEDADLPQVAAPPKLADDEPPTDASPESAPVARPLRRRDRALVGALLGAMVLVAILAAATITPRRDASPDPAAAVAGVDVRIVAGQPLTWDPARMGDAASAALLAQSWDGLTAFDAGGTVQPALAERWEIVPGGREVIFTLRPDLTFSDGTPLTAADVVRSWLRLIDPADPSPLAWLLADVAGARERLAGGPAEGVGLVADGDRVLVRLAHPASWFPAIAASPSLAVVPPGLDASSFRLPDTPLAVSGAYVPEAAGDDLVFRANPAWWGGSPPLDTVLVRTGTDGESPVSLYQDERADWVTITPGDATWIRWDALLGPDLRRSDDLSVSYYGFDARNAPFDDARVRRAVAQAVDWDRIVRLADPDATVATSLVPPGIPLRDDADRAPVHDPAAARAALAAAGFPGGRGFPAVTMATTGGATDAAVAAALATELGIEVVREVIPFTELTDRMAEDPPGIWSLDWLADYPHPQDFLGLLLATGSPSNLGGWSDPRFDRALAEAAAAPDPDDQAAALAEAERIVRDEAPLIPLRYGVTWALSRDGLLGAQPSGLGFLRFSGLAWRGR